MPEGNWNCMRKESSTQGSRYFHHFWKSLFFFLVCSSHSNALKGITVYIVQSIGRKYLNSPIISKWDYKQKGKNKIWFFDKGQNNWIMSVIYFSLFNIRSGTLHFTNRINMNITSSHKLADNQHKIWGTVLNQKNHASMKEIIIIYTIESISVLQKLSCIYLYLVH